jgi:formate hydrogenlyase subunit 3/multisubunit Na+/H+ antiporter MnhD subunit
MDEERPKRAGGCFGCIWGEAAIIHAFIIALLVLIVVFFLRLHSHAPLGHALITTVKDAFIGVFVSAFSQIIIFVSIVCIENWRRRNKQWKHLQH